MTKHLLVLTVLVSWSLCAVGAAAAQSCEPTPQRQTHLLSGEISGKHTFERPITDSWTLKLQPSRYGWDLRVVDRDSLDLSQITPPFRLAPNARDLYGWHFRNAANTGANIGDVNAPQKMRLFFFSPALSETGGFKPSSTDGDQPNEKVGRGALTILDMGLADLEPGDKARMTYLKFHVCLSWPKTDETIGVETDLASPVFSGEEREFMFACGFDGDLYELSAWVLPRMLEGDVDGDDAIDHVAPVIRKSDGRRGLALCRAGTWLSMTGYQLGLDIPLKTESGEPRDETYFSSSQYLERIEYWQLRKDELGQDQIILGRTEKAELVLSWEATGLVHTLTWVYVEP